jgi:hypothetical protein
MIQKVGPQLPEYMMLTHEMKGILPIKWHTNYLARYYFFYIYVTNFVWNLHYNRFFGIPDGQKDLD